MQRLFERLTHAQARRDRVARGQGSVFDQQDSPPLASVKAHLSRLLNTRRGSARVDENYGLPMLAVSPGNNALADRQAVAALVVAVIERYDPRLTQTEVSLSARAGDATALDCRIRARIRPGLLPPGAESRIELNARLMTDGTFVFE